MKGWGSVACLIGLGLSIASGCGSRTGGFDDFYYGDDDDDDGNGGTPIGGAGPVAGKPSKGGTPAVAGKPSKGGTATGGSRPIGGSVTGGTGPIGGTGIVGGTGGTGFGGFVFGGEAGFGAAPLGGFGGVPQSCQTCLFESCSGQFLQCLQDIGCIEIIACAQQAGCQGIDCYDPNTCKKVIDRWGGPAGDSMKELLQTFGCAANAGCPCSQ